MIITCSQKIDGVKLCKWHTKPPVQRKRIAAVIFALPFSATVTMANNEEEMRDAQAGSQAVSDLHAQLTQANKDLAEQAEIAKLVKQISDTHERIELERHKLSVMQAERKATTDVYKELISQDIKAQARIAVEAAKKSADKNKRDTNNVCQMFFSLEEFQDKEVLEQVRSKSARPN